MIEISLVWRHRFCTQLGIDIMTRYSTYIHTLDGYIFPFTSSELGYVEDEIFKKRQQNDVSAQVSRPL